MLPGGEPIELPGAKPPDPDPHPAFGPLSPPTGRGEKGGEGTTFPGALPPATQVQPLRG